MPAVIYVLLPMFVLVTSQQTDIDITPVNSPGECSYTYVLSKEEVANVSCVGVHGADSQLSNRLAILEHGLRQIRTVVNIPSTQYHNYPIIYPEGETFELLLSIKGIPPFNFWK